MNVYIDTNVIIDLLAKREPFYNDALNLFSKIAQQKRLVAFTSVKSMTDVYYLMRNSFHDEIMARKTMAKLISLLYVADNTDIDLLKSFSCKTKDLEDALISQLAYRMKLDYIVTRNKKDFDSTVVKAVSVQDILEMHELPELDADR